MIDLTITLIDKIKSYSSKVGCFGPVSEIIPNPCIINPWIKEEKKRVWTVIGHPDHALVVFHEEDKCYRVERDIKPLTEKEIRELRGILAKALSKPLVQVSMCQRDEPCPHCGEMAIARFKGTSDEFWEHQTEEAGSRCFEKLNHEGN